MVNSTFFQSDDSVGLMPLQVMLVMFWVNNLQRPHGLVIQISYIDVCGEFSTFVGWLFLPQYPTWPQQLHYTHCCHHLFHWCMWWSFRRVSSLTNSPLDQIYNIDPSSNQCVEIHLCLFVSSISMFVVSGN